MYIAFVSSSLEILLREIKSHKKFFPATNSANSRGIYKHVKLQKKSVFMTKIPKSFKVSHRSSTDSP